METNDIYSSIVLNNSKREKKALSKYACLSRKGVRKYEEKIPDKKNIRPVFAHDADRIIHSLAYARYIDKTQVFYLFKHDHITHRVLHVQFVSKIGKVIGRCLRLNEDLIEAIALGHDLGHVPYGHDGEQILNDICKENKIGYFCHNAQSVRFLMEIEQDGKGLNLSLQVLDGILAHNGEILNQLYKPNYNKTWYTLDEEYKKCFSAKDYSKSIYPMTLEGCVVRIADIIAYIGRDIEDAIIVKLIERKDIPKSIKKVLGDNNKDIINTLVMDIVKNSYDKEYLEFSDDMYKALKELMDFNYNKIYNDDRIKTQTDKIKFIFQSLFDRYCDDLEKKRGDSALFQYFLETMSGDYRSETNPQRQVVDFIAGMTDNFFNNQFKELFVPESYGYSIDEPILKSKKLLYGKRLK